MECDVNLLWSGLECEIPRHHQVLGVSPDDTPPGVGGGCLYFLLVLGGVSSFKK